MKSETRQIIDQLKQAYKDDLPGTIDKLTEEAIKTFSDAHDHESLITFFYCCLQITGYEERLQQAAEEGAQTAAEEGDLALSAIYHLVAGQTAMPWEEQEADTHYRQALSDPAFLASIPAANYPWLIKKSDDSQLFDGSLLGFIGTQSGCYDILYDYYKNTDNRAAACFSRIHAIKEKGSQTEKYALLQEVLKEYSDLPVVCEAVNAIVEDDLLPDIKSEGLARENALAAQEYNFLRPYADTFAGYKHIKLIVSRLRQLESPLTELHFNELATPHQSITFSLKRRNTESVTLSIYPTDLTGRNAVLNPNNDKEREKLMAHSAASPIFSKTFSYQNEQPYLTYEEEIEIEGFPIGIYMVKVSNNHGAQEIHLLHVSHLMAITERLPNNHLRIVVVDNQTGHPIPNAKVSLQKSWDYDSSAKTIDCDQNGEVIYNCKGWRNFEPYRLFPFTKTDMSARNERVSSYKNYDYNSEREWKDLEILTDRAIYRPGQTIHAAIVYYSVDKEKRMSVNSQVVEVILSKHYSNPICKIKMNTDDMGVAHCDFTIPEDTLPGIYNISCEHRQKSIRIEAYKRPTFEVNIEDYPGSYKDGDTIYLEGEARSYAGQPVAQAIVIYRVRRAWSWWWRFFAPYWEVEGSYGRYGEDKYHEGEAITDEEGHFKIEVPMRLKDSISSEDAWLPLFKDIIVEVDVTDITGETQRAEKTLPLSNRSYIMRVEMEEKTEVSRPVVFTVSIKNALGQDLDKDLEYWIDDTADTIYARSNTEIQLPNLSIGKHVLHVRYGEEEQKQEFIVFDKDAQEVPYDTSIWAYQSAEVFPEDGSDVTLQIGCSEADTYIIYNVFSGNKILESGAERCNTGMINRRFSYRKEYGSAILVTYAWVRDKQMKTHNFVIRKPMPKTQLQLTWKTFRDRVSPGTTERWVLNVRDTDGNKVPANVIATLYDKSLDQLAKDSWEGFGPQLEWNVPSTIWLYSAVETNRITYAEERWLADDEYDFYELVPLELDRKDMESSRRRKYQRRGLFEMETNDICYCAAAPGVPFDEEDHAEEPLSLREDMSETAFFLPTLRTDDTGDVGIEFHLPDSLTTWRFKAIAHTRNLHHAYIEGEAIARKAVMVQPNMPRFVRVGDTTTLSAKITNTMEKEISGKVVFELMDARDEHKLLSISRPFTLPANGTGAETFQFTPDEEVKDYICRIYAMGENFSDGEQHLLPVLPDKTDVTVTHIITQDGAGTEKVDTARLLPPDSTRREFSLQYTSHPIWLAVKALPAISDPDADNAISVSAALYCDHLTFHLQKQIMAFGELEGINSRKRDKSIQKLIKKLKKLQHVEGGFSWYPKMPCSLFITTEVVMHLSRMQTFVGKQHELDDILEQAFLYCDRSMCKEVSEMREKEQKGNKVFFPTFTILQHMYNCAITGRLLQGEAKSAYAYLIPLLEKDIHMQTMREKAMSAIILDYAGQKERAQVYAESLRQYTQCIEGRGRTFDTARASFSWYSYKIPTHVAGMEALYRLCPDDKTTLREMQRWLLEEKRTQAWDTPIDSVNAVHALLLDVTEYLADHRMPQFYADDEQLPVEIKGNEGYVESGLPATTRELKITKTSGGLSWGAVYARFLQSTHAVEDSGSGMTIKREILTEKKELHVGDRIRVRLTYTCARNYDMVTIIDSKAACMEPVQQLSWSDSFKYVEPLDTETRYNYYGLGEGIHSIETEYYLDRAGVYETGVATIVCTYAPEFRAICPSDRIEVKDVEINDKDL